jgi:hypothetical protein
MPGKVTRPLPAATLLWEALRTQVALHTAALTGPLPPGHGQCATCRGPAGGGFARCFQCAVHAESIPGALADVVVPVAFAPKGSPFAGALWQYKSGRAGEQAARDARRVLRALLLIFLHDHGRCVWRRAAMPVPTHVGVVPSSRGRPGPHPLRDLVRPYLTRPEARLVPAPGEPPGCRQLDPGRFRVAGPLDGASVLLLDDTWTSGSSAQSAAAACRAAGARHVAVVVLGRHLGPSDAAWGAPLRLDRCAVHRPAAAPAAGRGAGLNGTAAGRAAGLTRTTAGRGAGLNRLVP